MERLSSDARAKRQGIAANVSLIESHRLRQARRPATFSIFFLVHHILDGDDLYYVGEGGEPAGVGGGHAQLHHEVRVLPQKRSRCLIELLIKTANGLIRGQIELLESLIDKTLKKTYTKNLIWSPRPPAWMTSVCRKLVILSHYS